jgi:hypothetical protein
MEMNKVLGLTPNPEGNSIGVSQLNEKIEKIKEKLKKEYGFEINCDLKKSIYYNDVFDGLDFESFDIDFITNVIFKKIFVYWCEKMKQAGKLVIGDHVAFFLDYYQEKGILRIIENENEVIFQFKDDPLRQIGRIIGKQGKNIKKLSQIVGKKVVVRQ